MRQNSSCDAFLCCYIVGKSSIYSNPWLDVLLCTITTQQHLPCCPCQHAMSACCCPDRLLLSGLARHSLPSGRGHTGCAGNPLPGLPKHSVLLLMHLQQGVQYTQQGLVDATRISAASQHACSCVGISPPEASALPAVSVSDANGALGPQTADASTDHVAAAATPTSKLLQSRCNGATLLLRGSMGWLTAAALLAHICGTRLTGTRTVRCKLGTLRRLLDLDALNELLWPGASRAIDAAMFRGFFFTTYNYLERNTGMMSPTGAALAVRSICRGPRMS